MSDSPAAQLNGDDKMVDPETDQGVLANQHQLYSTLQAPGNNPIKERRLRAGMRYTQGGKKTYWLPVEPVDHRAVSFAAGGVGLTRAKLVHGTHGASAIRTSLEYAASSIHSSSRAMHESRRLHKYELANSAQPTHPAASLHQPFQPATERTHLLDQTPVNLTRLDQVPLQSLSVLSMDLGYDERAYDDSIYDEARKIEGDFNYPVMEVGVAFGYSRRRPYGNTLSRRASSPATAASQHNQHESARRPIHNDQFGPF
ncbi:hypothetical protein GGI22_004483 [Coemansia erecta]|nr:hypothetical protein GGI22_004483 [Coemansia erecta]